MKIKYEDIVNNDLVKKCIERADAAYLPRGGKEHGFPHATHVADMTRMILDAIGLTESNVELGAIAGYLHDIGYMINENAHEENGAAVAHRLLEKLNVDSDDISQIVTAIENCEGEGASPVSNITAALIIADAADLRRERVRKTSPAVFSKGDKANYYAAQARLEVDREDIKLNIETQPNHCSVMDYFEFVMDRMILCKRAAEKLGLKFVLIINDRKMF